LGSSGAASISANLSTEVDSFKMASLFDEWLNSFQSAALNHSSAAIPAVVLVAAPIIAIWAYRRQSSVKETSSWKDELNASKLGNSTSREDYLSASEIRSSASDATKDVWADRRKKGIAAASSHGVKTALADEKPFRSSYYYAHNNPGATGGYSDGLNMEDFTMNGPRLLSRSGTPQVSQEDVQNPELEPAATAPVSIPSSVASVKSKPATPEKRTLVIGRFLWDDPGDDNGVANIRIDQLPGALSTDAAVSWRDVTVSDASAEVTKGGGLLVIVRTTSEFDYKLHIPRLYGEVTSVKTIIKPQKRLLVRLYKTGGMWNRDNVKAWPNP
jgi:hypothetical protein